MPDKDLKRLVEGALEWELSVDAADIGAFADALKFDRSNAYAMFMTIPVKDVKKSPSLDAQVVMWKGRQAGAPPAIKERYLQG